MNAPLLVAIYVFYFVPKLSHPASNKDTRRCFRQNTFGAKKPPIARILLNGSLGNPEDGANVAKHRDVRE